MRKLAPVAQDAEKLGLAQLQPPDLNHRNGIVTALQSLHHPGYVKQVVTGMGRLASSNGFSWSPQIRDGVLAMNAGMLTATRLAMAHGIACNVSQGFHHSHYECGGGFCTFNGLALVAKQTPGRKVFVLDADQHGGDGTADFAETLPNLFNYSVCGSTFGAERHSRSVVDHVNPLRGDYRPYAKALRRAFRAADKFKPDVVIYQAGADPHITDPLGSVGLTDEMMFSRDGTVFDHFRRAGIPVVWVLAGGYQALEKGVELHVNTFRAAVAVH